MPEALRTYKKQLDSLNFLRGLAVLMVCFGHLGGTLDKDNPAAAMFDLFHQYGKYGVYIFFVISGFVIPLSFHRGKYQLADYSRFLYKRLLRLHPPYLLALALTLAIITATSLIKHTAVQETPISVLQSLFYLHAPLDNPVFWTLTVEAQYYLFVGFFFVLLDKYPRMAIGVGIPLLVAATYPFIGDKGVNLLAYLHFFLVGICGYVIYTEKGNKWLNYGMMILLLVWSFWFYPVVISASAFFAIGVILLYRNHIPKQLQFVGIVSYSLYLIHYPIGVKLVNLLKYKINPAYSVPLFIFILTLAITLAWIFNLVIERRSERLSQRIKYRQSIKPN